MAGVTGVVGGITGPPRLMVPLVEILKMPVERRRTNERKFSPLNVRILPLTSVAVTTLSPPEAYFVAVTDFTDDIPRLDARSA